MKFFHIWIKVRRDVKVLFGCWKLVCKRLLYGMEK